MDDAALLEPLRDLPGRAAEGAVVAEGFEAVSLLLASSWPVGAVLCDTGRARRLAAPAAARGVPLLTRSTAEISAILGYPDRRGCCAWAPRPPLADCTPAAGDVVLVGVHDPANVGSLVRSARCLGWRRVLVTPGSADPLSRRSVRTSMGHAFHLGLGRLADPVPALAAAVAGGLPVLAADSHGEPLRPGGDRDAGRACLVLGNEDRGLEPDLLAVCSRRLAIPMRDGVDSLSVTAAGAILLWALGSRDA
jgi:TrmH family RNA methyltransferase